MATEQFSLRWNNFHSNLTSGFHDLLQHADMVDVTLAVDGHFLQAHKIVLSICSPYFKQMFKANPCKHPIVILKDVSHENMKDILQFMYVGEVSVLRENLSTFLRTAELLQVKGLTGDESSEEPTRRETEKNDINHGDNVMYDQLIETTTDCGDVMPQFGSHSPTQTSPLPLSCTKKQPSKFSTTTSSKRAKTEPSPYLAKDNADKPKPTIVDYKNCDFPSAQLSRDIKLETGDDDEAKDYSKSSSWRCNFANQAPIDSSTMAVGDQTNAEQGNKSATTLKHGYQCGHCMKRFSRRDHLRTHEKNLHGSDAGPFKCTICEQFYKNTESLRKHLSKFHCANLNDATFQKVEVKA